MFKVAPIRELLPVLSRRVWSHYPCCRVNWLHGCKVHPQIDNCWLEMVCSSGRGVQRWVEMLLLSSHPFTVGRTSFWIPVVSCIFRQLLWADLVYISLREEMSAPKGLEGTKSQFVRSPWWICDDCTHSVKKVININAQRCTSTSVQTGNKNRAQRAMCEENTSLFLNDLITNYQSSHAYDSCQIRWMSISSMFLSLMRSDNYFILLSYLVNNWRF